MTSISVKRNIHVYIFSNQLQNAKIGWVLMELINSIQGAAIRSIGRFLSPAGQYAKLLILMYHRVHAEPDPLRIEEVDSRTFEWQMLLLRRYFNVLALPEAIERLRIGTLPQRAVCVTFDDGYADNYEVALPILKRTGVPATFFVAVGFLNGDRMWNDSVIESLRRTNDEQIDLRKIGLGTYSVASLNDRRQTIGQVLKALKHLSFEERTKRVDELLDIVGETLPANLMMTPEQVQELHMAGMDVGAHTINHPILTSIPVKQAEEEILGSRDILQQLLGQEITIFAYPNGQPGVDYNKRHVECIKRAGFHASVSTAWGYAENTTDIFQLPRIGSWGTSPLEFCGRMLKTYLTSKPQLL